MKETLWWSFPGAAKRKQNKAASGEEKLERSKMNFTGTLIEDLIATVERAERTAQSDGALRAEPRMVESLLVESLFVESLVVEPWFASVQKNRDYDPKFIGVA